MTSNAASEQNPDEFPKSMACIQHCIAAASSSSDTPVTENSASAPAWKAMQELGDSFLSIGNNDQAQQYYEKAAILNADEPAPYVGLGIVSMRKNMPDDARLAFQVASRLDPRCSRAYEGMGMLAQQQGDCERAFEMFLKSLELDTDNLTALLGLFQTSLQMRSFAKIIHYLEIYLDMHPVDILVMFTLATLYIKEDHFDKSRTTLLKILDLEPNNKDAAYLLEEIERKLTRIIPL